MNPSTESPCIGICSTVYGDNICRGCKRHYLEVIEWNRYEALQKQAINHRLEEQIKIVATEFVRVLDEHKLKAKLDQVALRPTLYTHPLCWAYELLRLRAQRMKDLSAYGLCAKSPYQTLSINGLFTVMDDQLYETATTVAR